MANSTAQPHQSAWSRGPWKYTTHIADVSSTVVGMVAECAGWWRAVLQLQRSNGTVWGSKPLGLFEHEDAAYAALRVALWYWRGELTRANSRTAPVPEHVTVSDVRAVLAGLRQVPGKHAGSGMDASVRELWDSLRDVVQEKGVGEQDGAAGQTAVRDGSSEQVALAADLCAGPGTLGQLPDAADLCGHMLVLKYGRRLYDVRLLGPADDEADSAHSGSASPGQRATWYYTLAWESVPDNEDDNVFFTTMQEVWKDLHRAVPPVVECGTDDQPGINLVHWGGWAQLAQLSRLYLARSTMSRIAGLHTLLHEHLEKVQEGSGSGGDATEVRVVGLAGGEDAKHYDDLQCVLWPHGAARTVKVCLMDAVAMLEGISADRSPDPAAITYDVLSTPLPTAICPVLNAAALAAAGVNSTHVSTSHPRTPAAMAQHAKAQAPSKHVENSLSTNGTALCGHKRARAAVSAAAEAVVRPPCRRLARSSPESPHPVIATQHHELAAYSDTAAATNPATDVGAHVRDVSPVAHSVTTPCASVSPQSSETPLLPASAPAAAFPVPLSPPPGYLVTLANQLLARPGLWSVISLDYFLAKTSRLAEEVQQGMQAAALSTQLDTASEQERTGMRSLHETPDIVQRRIRYCVHSTFHSTQSVRGIAFVMLEPCSKGRALPALTVSADGERWTCKHTPVPETRSPRLPCTSQPALSQESTIVGSVTSPWVWNNKAYASAQLAVVEHDAHAAVHLCALATPWLCSQLYATVQHVHQEQGAQLSPRRVLSLAHLYTEAGALHDGSRVGVPSAEIAKQLDAAATQAANALSAGRCGGEHHCMINDAPLTELFDRYNRVAYAPVQSPSHLLVVVLCAFAGEMEWAAAQV